MGVAASNSLPPPDLAYGPQESTYATESHTKYPVLSRVPEAGDFGGDEGRARAAIAKKCCHVRVFLFHDTLNTVDLLHVPGAWNVVNPRLLTTPNTKVRISFTKRDASGARPDSFTWCFDLVSDGDGVAPIDNRVIFVAYCDSYTELKVITTVDAYLCSDF